MTNRSTGNPRGRPVGHKLSQETKDKIARSKTGSIQSEETKDKISISLKEYFREQHKVSMKQELDTRYEEVSDWIDDNIEDIAVHIYTERQINNKQYMEVPTPREIMDTFIVEDLDPLKILLIKEEMEERENGNKQG